MVRFNLYKACFVHLQTSFLKLGRLIEWLALDAFESDAATDSLKHAFDFFGHYCANVMRLRKKEVIEEKRINRYDTLASGW